ncbi:DUF5590 domain-containing protein [Bacillus sp. FJAT-47783]|uniref:cell wall elongation regulator TseB-like domain-containing protein n=1 Tax=Bacillus sp. FJAT-47783 TaxID=2922712 RepID=UPI001FAC8A07|nr:DUF5590 domain-containing protein [Bacillus sp. FJAT-47783]
MDMNRKGMITLIISIVMVVFLASTIFILRSALADKTDGHAFAEQVAKKNGVKNIEEVSTYNSDHVYYVVKGQNQKKQKVIAFVPKDESKKVKIVLEKNGLSKKEVLQLVSTYDDNKKPKKIISMEIGYDDSEKPKWDIPVWEVRYVDQKNRYTYFIVSFTDSKVYKAYSIQR